MGAARRIQTPWAGPVTHHVLPADLADVLRAGSGRLQVDDADALGGWRKVGQGVLGVGFTPDNARGVGFGPASGKTADGASSVR